MERYPSYIKEIARRFRKNPTQAESILWERLRRRQLSGLKFKRQYRIGRFIVDFYCRELNLVIELEGGIHNFKTQQEYDIQRFEELQARGFDVLRIENQMVLDKVDLVLDRILQFKR